MNYLKTRIKIKWILGILGAILLGAIGSGVWSIVLEPSFAWIGGSIFQMATLGLSSIRSSLYKDIAMGFHEEPSIIVLNLLLIALSLGFLLYSVFDIIKERAKRVTEQKLLKTELALKGLPISEMQEKTLSYLERELEKAKHTLYIIHISSTIFAFFLLSLVFFQIFITTYKNNAITNFRQCLSICGPFLSIEEERLIESRFSRVNNRESYFDVISYLYKKAEENNTTCPKITVF